MALLALTMFVVGCSTTTVVVATPPPASDDDDFSELIAQLRVDLNRHNGRQIARTPTLTATATTTKERNKEFSARASALFAPLSGRGIFMPVVGVQPFDLSNSWGEPRDGGRRKHRGIDIFAPRGTGVVAVADGIISFIGDQPKGGHCLWLTTESGSSFYYAHLDRWAAGLYEGMEVRSGDLLGYVGNTGNARTTPPHLHFAINQNDEMVNPYPILTRASAVKRARVAVESGSAMGTR
ncbi:MAG TPA: M23 family metallopeptidase [Thermoanaerobaculia bacterium]|nr:M23 family metallopeptidase [Thermoanaerobaculia bacterium]